MTKEKLVKNAKCVIKHVFDFLGPKKKGAGAISLRRPGIVTGILPVWSVVRYSAADGVTVSLAG